MAINWERSEDGYVDSKDGRFKISPLFCGRVKPQWFVCKDTEVKRDSSWCSTQRDAKEWAEQQLMEEETYGREREQPLASADRAGAK